MEFRLPAMSLVCLAAVVPTMAATPVFQPQGTSAPVQTIRMQEYLRLDVSATDSSGHTLVYDWSINADPTGKAYFDSETLSATKTITGGGNVARVAFPWVVPEETPAEASQWNTQYIGQSVCVQVTARHANPADGAETAITSFSIQITGVNHPPVPVITGYLGSPTDRIPSGSAVSCVSDQSSDPDPGDSFGDNWFLSLVMPSAYLKPLVPYGTDGTAMSFTVPPMTAPVDQPITLRLTDGMNVVQTTVVAYLKPAVADPSAKPTALVSIKASGFDLSSPVEQGTVVTLDGSASVNAEGGKVGLLYAWRQVSGPQVTLSSTNSAVTSFVAPAVGADGTVLGFELAVTDLAISASATKQANVSADMPSTYFAHVGVGELSDRELHTALLLINKSSQSASNTSVEFFNSAGQLFAPLVNGEPWANHPFEIPPGASKRLLFTPAGGQTEIGWVRVSSAVRLTGLALFQVVDRLSGEVRQETSVLSSTRTRRATSYFALNEETAVAVANPGAAPAAVRVKLIGDAYGQGTVIKDLALLPQAPGGLLASKNQNAQFLTPAFFGQLPAGFQQGTLVIESDNEVVVTLLKTKGGIVLSAPPVAAESKQEPPESFIAQVGAGPLGADELRTVVLLVNGGSKPAQAVKLACYDEQGGTLQAKVDGQTWLGAPFDIPAYSCKRLEFSSQKTQVGWARVTSTVGVAGLAFFQVVGSAQKDLKREMSVFSSTTGRRFLSYFNVDEEVAIAVANAGPYPAHVTLKLVDHSSGQQRIVKQTALFPELGALGPMQHAAKFIDAALLGSLPSDFKHGTLALESDADIVVTILKTQNGVVLSALPLASAP